MLKKKKKKKKKDLEKSFGQIKSYCTSISAVSCHVLITTCILPIFIIELHLSLLNYLGIRFIFSTHITGSNQNIVIIKIII